MKWTLFYFDDQIQNIECLGELLAEDFNLIGTTDVANFPQMFEKNSPHAILMDVHMPIIDGHELYQKISEHPHYNGCPVIFISGDHSDENKIKSYLGGGIDFLPRTIRPEEISVRLKNKIKFYLDRITNLELGNLEIDLKEMKSLISGQNVELTLLELRMLSSLLRVYPQILTRDQLIGRVWGGGSVKPGTVNTHLTNLKPKIENWDHQIKVRDENILVQKKSAV